jgi:hypothetical protein
MRFASAKRCGRLNSFIMLNKDNPAPQEKTFWDQALATFLEDFSPAADLTDSTRQYTTAEIQNLLYEHTGEAIPKTLIYESMDALGFKYCNTGSDFEWLLKKN